MYKVKYYIFPYEDDIDFTLDTSYRNIRTITNNFQF